MNNTDSWPDTLEIVRCQQCNAMHPIAEHGSAWHMTAIQVPWSEERHAIALVRAVKAYAPDAGVAVRWANSLDWRRSPWHWGYGPIGAEHAFVVFTRTKDDAMTRDIAEAINA